MPHAMRVADSDCGDPITQLKQYGTLQESLHSNASAKFKAAFVDIGNASPICGHPVVRKMTVDGVAKGAIEVVLAVNNSDFCKNTVVDFDQRVIL